MSRTKLDSSLPRSPELIASVLLLLLALLAFSCNGEKATSRRMIPPAALAVLPWAELVKEDLVVSWSAEADPSARSGWAGSGLAAGQPIALSLARGETQALRHVAQVDATDIDLIVVRTSTPFKGSLALYWTAPEARFGQDRSALANRSVRSANGHYESRFDLRGNPLWQGRIGRVRLSLRAHRGEALDISLLTIEARRRGVLSGLGAMAGDGAWRIELDHEMRDGFPCVPGAARHWRLPAVPRRAETQLRFGFGTEPLAEGTVRFEIRSSVDSSKPPLWSAEIEARSKLEGVWHDVTLEPESLPTELWFSCHHEGGIETTRALALWAAPRLSAKSTAQHRPNLVLISIDTLRPDRLSLYGHQRQTSPNLDRWAQQAVVFERAVTSSPWTLPAHLSMLSGLDALQHGVHHPVRVPAAVPLIADRLRDEGYQTAAWVGGGFMSPSFGLDRGFDRYRWWQDHTGEQELEDGVARALEWLASAPSEPFFLFLHTYEVHHPYRPREPYYSRWAPDESPPQVRDLAYISEHRESFQLEKLWRYREGKRNLRELSKIELRRLNALYDSGVAYADELLAPLLQLLSEPPFGERTAVIVTSDHGEALGDKGLAGHAYLEEFNSLVPLVVRLPGGTVSNRVPSQVRLADVAPTLLGLAGIAAPTTDGSESLLSLLSASDPEDRPATTYAAFSNQGLAVRPDRRWKLVFLDTALAPLGGHTRLFDLERDPDETTPVDDPARTRSLHRQAQREIATMRGVFRVHLENRSAGELEGVLAGPALGPLQVKAAQLPTTAIEYREPGECRWQLAAGERLTLLVQNPQQYELRIDADGTTIATLEHRDITGGWSIQRVDGEWTTDLQGGSGDATISIEWPAELSGLDVDPAATDDALRRQLETLGYIQ